MKCAWAAPVAHVTVVNADYLLRTWLASFYRDRSLLRIERSVSSSLAGCNSDDVGIGSLRTQLTRCCSLLTVCPTKARLAVGGSP